MGLFCLCLCPRSVLSGWARRWESVLGASLGVSFLGSAGAGLALGACRPCCWCLSWGRGRSAGLPVPMPQVVLGTNLVLQPWGSLNSPRLSGLFRLQRGAGGAALEGPHMR